VALALASCGGEPDDDRARDAVRNWIDALAEGRAADACGAMTAAGRRELVQMAQLFAGAPRAVRECERQVRHLGGRPGGGADLEIRSVSVEGDAATVETRGGPARVRLRREGGEWRVHGFLTDGWREFGIPGARPAG
jgi:hypothetical protein